MNFEVFESLLFPKKVIDIEVDEYNRIQTLPLAQKRCSIYKKYVRVDPEFIIKGPYTLRDKAFKRVLMCNKAMIALDYEYNTKTFVTIHSIVKYGDEYFLRWRLIGDYDSIQLSQLSTRVDKDGTYIRRTSLNRRVSDIEKDPVEFTPELADLVITHLYFRFLLDIGDSGAHNIIYIEDEKTIAGVDFDETRRSQNGITRFKLLFGAHPTVYREKIYKAAIARFKPLETLSVELRDFFYECGFNTQRVRDNLYLFKFCNS